MDNHEDKDFRKAAIEKEKRHLKARGGKAFNVLQGFKIAGIVGWSVVIPMLLAIPLGLWLDYRSHKGSYHYTLMLMLAGMTLGCIIALVEISKAISDDETNGNNNHGGDNEKP